MTLKRPHVVIVLQVLVTVFGKIDENKVLNTIDSDSNGIIDLNEFRACGLPQTEEVRKHLDTNGDGSISLAELGAAVAALRTGGGAQPKQAVLSVKKRTEKERLDEFPKARKIFDEMDMDHDGSLSSDELGEFGFGYDTIIRGLDVNADHVLSRSEFDTAVGKSVGLSKRTRKSVKKRSPHGTKTRRYSSKRSSTASRRGKKSALIEASQEVEVPPQPLTESNYCYRLRWICKTGRPGRHCERYCRQCYEGHSWNEEYYFSPYTHRVAAHRGFRRGGKGRGYGYGLLEEESAQSDNDMDGVCGGSQAGFVEDFTDAMTGDKFGMTTQAPMYDSHLSGWNQWYSNHGS